MALLFSSTSPAAPLFMHAQSSLVEQQLSSLDAPEAGRQYGGCSVVPRHLPCSLPACLPACLPGE